MHWIQTMLTKIFEISLSSGYEIFRRLIQLGIYSKLLNLHILYNLGFAEENRLFEQSTQEKHKFIVSLKFMFPAQLLTNSMLTQTQSKFQSENLWAISESYQLKSTMFV